MLSGSYIKRNEITSRADSLASNLQNSYNDFWKDIVFLTLCVSGAVKRGGALESQVGVIVYPGEVYYTVSKLKEKEVLWAG